MLDFFQIINISPPSNLEAFMELFDVNEARLSKASKALYEDVKNIIFPKHVAFSKDVDQVYE